MRGAFLPRSEHQPSFHRQDLQQRVSVPWTEQSDNFREILKQELRRNTLGNLGRKQKALELVSNGIEYSEQKQMVWVLVLLLCKMPLCFLHLSNKHHTAIPGSETLPNFPHYGGNSPL